VGICDLNCSDEYAMECASITPSKFSEELGVPLVHTLEDFLLLGPDGVIIANETIEHCTVVTWMIQKNIHVFTAKPLTFNLSQAIKIKKMARKTTLLCGNPLKYEQGLVEVKELLEQKKLGDLISLRILINHQAMLRSGWERDPDKSGGPLGTYGIYLIDLTKWFARSNIKTVFAIGDNYCYPQIGTHDTVSAVAKLQNNVLCSLQLLSTIEHEYPFVRVEAVGKEGTLTTHYDNYSYLFSSTESVKLGALRCSDMGRAEMNHFVDCIRGKSVERCNIEDMIHVAMGIEAIAKSIETGLLMNLEVMDL